MSTATDATIGTLNARHGLTLTTDYTDELTIPCLLYTSPSPRD